MAILCLGSCNIDYCYTVDEFVRAGETRQALQFEKRCGGKGLNQAVALARAGAHVYMAGQIGEDGAFLRHFLEEQGIDVSFLEQGSVPTGHARIEVDISGQNRILLYGGANQAICKERMVQILQRFTEKDSLILQNEINCGKEALEAAVQQGIAVYINPSPITPDLENWPLQRAKALIVNEVEGACLSGETQFLPMLDTLVKKFDTEVVLTVGGEGAYAGKGNERFFQPAFSVPVIDTTGAGDTFLGYYVTARQEGLSIPRSLERSCKASAIAVTQKGGAPSIPCPQDVEQAQLSLTRKPRQW